MDEDRSGDIAAAFRRIQRPLRWPMEDFGRKRIRTSSFDGYRFFRRSRAAEAGFAFGFALRADALPGIRDPPEAVAFAFVEPVGSALHRELVLRPRSPVRRLVRQGEALGYPFELHLDHPAAAIRHRPLGRLPPELFVLAASDFFMLSQNPIRGGGFLREVVKATAKPRG